MSEELFNIPVSAPSELDVARARFHSAQDAFHKAQEAEDECELGMPMPREIREEYRHAARDLLRLEKLEILRRRGE